MCKENESKCVVSIHELQSAFVELLPKIEHYARFKFRLLACPHLKADAVAETVALAWKSFCSLAENGRDATNFPTVIVGYAVSGVRNGRRVAGQEQAKDVLSNTAQRRYGFSMLPLVAEALTDNTRTPIPDQVQFRCDFPAWRRTLSSMSRKIADRLAEGHRTQDVAAAVGVTAGRVSQLRRELFHDYERFCDGPTV